MARDVKCGLTASRVKNCRPVMIAGSTAAGSKRAEVVACKALLELKTLAAGRDKGLLRLEGRECVVLDGDVINFRFGGLSRWTQQTDRTPLMVSSTSMSAEGGY